MNYEVILTDLKQFGEVKKIINLLHLIINRLSIDCQKLMNR
jgi:hypothetical protein